jgi:hypothetical protein
MSERHILQKQGLIESIAAVWSVFREKVKKRNELACLDRIEARRIREEFGLSIAELTEMIGQGPDAAKQLYQRLAQARINAEAISPEAMQDMQRCCGHCDSKALCDYELQDEPKTASWPKYCPNELTITALKAGSCH